MKTIVIFAVIALVLALLVLIYSIRLITKKRKLYQVYIMLCLSLFVMLFGICVIYFNPNFVKEDFIKETPYSFDYSFQTDPTICDEIDDNGLIVLMCPAWIQNNIQLLLAIDEEYEDGFIISLIFPSSIRLKNVKYNKMYVNIGADDIGEYYTIKSSSTKCYNNEICYFFSKDDFEVMGKYGITSVAYQSPNGIGFWRRFNKSSLLAINEQMNYLLDYYYSLKWNKR